MECRGKLLAVRECYTRYRGSRTAQKSSQSTRVCCGLEQFSESRFDTGGVCDPAIAGMLPKIRIEAADDLTQRYPASWPVRLKVTYRDGHVERREADFPRGNPENPVSTVELEAKFLSVVAPRLGGETARRALQAARSVEACRDMAVLFCGLS